MSNRRGTVKLSGELAGTIEESGKQTTFTYAREWLAPCHALVGTR